jgi:hypothetical protein
LLTDSDNHPLETHAPNWSENTGFCYVIFFSHSRTQVQAEGAQVLGAEEFWKNRKDIQQVGCLKSKLWVCGWEAWQKRSLLSIAIR